jgi:hypothetical protein
VRDVLIIVVPAALAFVAAVFGTIVAYRQWKGQHSFERSKSFLDDRAAAYKELWSRLEAIHISLRTTHVLDDEFDSALLDLYSYILSSEVYFDPGIRDRTKAYLEAARRVATIIKDAPPAVQRDHAITATLEIDAADMRVLAAELQVAEDARAAIMAEVRSNIGG